MCIGERPLAQSQRDDYAFARVRSHDADEHAARLSGWDQTYEQLTPGRFEGFLCEALFADIQLCRETTNQSVHELGSGRRGSYMFGVPLALQGEGYFGGRPIGLDSIVVLRDRGPLDFRAPAPLDIVGVSMPIEALCRYALEIDQRDIDAELREVCVAEQAPERVRRLRAFLLLALESICGHPQKLQHPVTRRALEHAVYGSIVDTFAGVDEAAAPGPTRSHALVSRAQEYMREHVDEPLTVEDLCRELKVSRRTLQYGFREVLRLNPVAYLRALRLNGVRRALRNPVRGTTVQDVAARWGFWHLSHFACDYRRMFGELPSETLHRAARA